MGLKPLPAALAIAALASAAQAQAAGAPQTIAHLEDRAVFESSGVAASRVNPGIYWTHNDSGDDPVIYAFDREGRNRGRWKVTGARTVDWEDIAVGPGPVAGRWYVYAADIGDNSRRRKEITVYRVPEPKTGGDGCRRGCASESATALRLRYPNAPHNAEALLIHPATGDLYIVSKASKNDPETTVFVARARELGPGPVTLTALARLPIPESSFRNVIGGITGGDISPDGRRLVLCDYFRLFEAVLPAGAAFDEIWKQPFRPVMLGMGLQTEAVCYRTDGKAIIATSEGGPCPVMEVPVQ